MLNYSNYFSDTISRFYTPKTLEGDCEGTLQRGLDGILPQSSLETMTLYFNGMVKVGIW